MAQTFFGIQVVVRNFVTDPLRRQLHELIAQSQSEQSLTDKRSFWKRVTAVLNEAVPAFELGYWDLINQNGDEEFESWSSDIEGSLATEAEELGTAPDEVNRISAEKRYVIVTLLFLVEGGSNSDQTLAERCDIPESEWFTRITFGKLIASIPGPSRASFSWVRRSCTSDAFPRPARLLIEDSSSRPETSFSST